MKLSEIKQELGNGKKIEELVEVKSFISLATKKVLVDNILNTCLDYDENGLLKCDFISKELSYNLNLLNFYADIELDGEDIAEDYNYLDEEKIFYFIRDNIAELYAIDCLLDDELEQRLELENSLSSVVAKGINKLIDKIPTNRQLKNLSKSVVKDLNSLDWNKLPMLKEMLDVAQGKEVKK